MSKEAASLVKCRDELTVIAKMIDDGSHAGSAAATGLVSRGNRSSIDAGKRNSLTREHAHSLNWKIIHPRSGGMVRRNNGLNR